RLTQPEPLAPEGHGLWAGEDQRCTIVWILSAMSEDDGRWAACEPHGPRSARGPRVPRRRPKRSPRPPSLLRSPDREGDDERALRTIFAYKPWHQAHQYDEVADYTRECEKHHDVDREPGYAIPDPSKPVTDTGDVIDDFLCHLEVDEANRPSSAHVSPVQVPTSRPVGARGADRLAEQVEDLRSKLAHSFRENRRLKEMLDGRDQKIRRLLDDIDRIRKDPNVMHPSISRLRKMGLNTPGLADLGDRWAGYVFGRTSMAMEVGSFSYRNVFVSHATNGVLTEDSFKAVIRQFEPSIKSDQLTRLWFFADEDGSGKIDLFEFMRMIGCNSNGEMTDEYYEVLAMHLYRKFHARGGVRRVYATADKNWDHHLDLAEFSKLIKTYLKDVEFTKREVSQVFQRINASGSGWMSVQELENALEAAGAKCYVSDAWVKDTFQHFAVAVQESGLSIKQLFSGVAVTEKEFREAMLQFLRQLRPSQLDRLWKYLLAACSEETVQTRHSGDKDRLPSDAVMSVVLGPTLTSSPNEQPPVHPGTAPALGPPGGVGREVLEQLVQRLVRRVGDVSPDPCFDALNPFITSEHFNELLNSRLGLHYDPVKAKQIFKLIDSDRDGKITRLEFSLMFKTVTPETRRDSFDLTEDLDKETERLQVNRLQNRVLLLQRELELLRGPSGRGHMEPMVPEKQFQQLSTAHGKVANQLHAIREQRKAANVPEGQDSEPPSRHESCRRLSETFPRGFSTASDAEDERVKEQEELRRREAEQFQVQLQELTSSNEYLRRRLCVLEADAAKKGVYLASDEETEEPTDASPSQARGKQGVEPPLPLTEELYGEIHRMLARLQKAMQKNPNLPKRQVQELMRKAGDLVIEGRWKLKSVQSYSPRNVTVVCHDIFLCQDVLVKLSQTCEASQELARVVYVLRKLSSVSIAPDVHYFSSPTSSLPFMVMDLLQGSTLQKRFQDIAENQAEPIGELEAAEIGCALLTGMDACHQHQVFNLNLCPENVWVAPEFDGSRIRILDWSNAEIGAASLENPQFYSFADMKKRGAFRGDGQPLFLTCGSNTEVQPSDIWLCARKRESTSRASSLSAMSKLAIYGHGCLYYMSMEQLYGAIRAFEKSPSTSRPEQTWHQESVGSVVKVEGRTAHWFQKGDGFVQTSLPVDVTPLGQLFEVKIGKAVNVGRRSDSELGFCIGLCSRPPRSEKTQDKKDCWIAGGDSSFTLKGVVHRVDSSSREDSFADGEDKFLYIASELRKEDTVAILAEWSGTLSLFINGDQVGRFLYAIDPIEVMSPLYGVADMHVQEPNDEYTIRSISLLSEEGKGKSVLPELMERSKHELAGIYQHLQGEAAVATTIGPSCDLYACGRMLLSCFRGGQEPLPCLNLDRFAVAYADWARAGCPSTEKCYGLLWALKELKNEKAERSEEISQIDKMELKLLLSRCIKRSRYSRLGSCWEAAEMLAQASCWLGMSDAFLSSHKEAVEQAKRANLLDSHYSLAQEMFQQDRRISRENVAARAEAAVQTAVQHKPEGVSAKWNLRAFSLGPPHIRRIIQVLKEWSEGKLIQAVSFSRFEADIQAELQDSLIQCFSDTLQPHQRVRHNKRRRDLRHSVAVNLADFKPTMFLEDFRLPLEELPRSSFPLEEILSRNVLWLVVLFVRRLDLTPAPAGLGQEKPLTVCTAPALDTLTSAMERSSILTSLSLRSSNLRDHSGLQLATAAGRCPSLRELDLSDNFLGPKAVAKVIHCVRDNLEILDLSRNRLGDEGAKAIADAFKGPAAGQSLAVLRLRANGIGNEGGEALAEALMSVTSMLEFDFAENQVDVQTAAVILRATCAARTLKRLCLDSNLPWPTSENCEVQVAGFTDQLSGHQAVPSLEMLSLRRCKIHSTGAMKLFESLASNQTLRHLNAACNGLRQGAAHKIATALACNTTLEELDLRDNRLGVQDALAIALHQVFANANAAPELSKSPTQTQNVEASDNRRAQGSLRVLNLGNNEISGEAVPRIAAALCHFRGLQELYIYHNPQLGDVGTQALAHLVSTGSLRRLSVAACGVGDAGCQALMAAIEEKNALKTLDMSCNSIGDDSAPGVASVLAQRDCAIEKLVLSMNSLSSFGISQLMDGVARNIEGQLLELDVGSQDVGLSKTCFVADEPLSPRSSSKVKTKFLGLR
ncbi:unnamed protein product, partial [Effrenium voratum]